MATFKVQGGNKLSGEIIPQGAKNEALQILCAVLLTSEKVIIENIPNIRDVNILINLLEDLEVKVKKIDANTYSFQADKVNVDYLTSEDYKKKSSSIRGSIMMIGPLLARFGKGFIPRPGGDKIGRRRLDTHFNGFKKLGANFNYDSKEEFYRVSSSGLKGANSSSPKVLIAIFIISLSLIPVERSCFLRKCFPASINTFLGTKPINSDPVTRIPLDIDRSQVLSNTSCKGEMLMSVRL